MRGVGTWRHSPSLRAAGVALGDIHVHCAWQAWRLRHWAGSGGAFGRRLGKHSTWRHPPLHCVSGMAFHDIHLHFVWQAWHACDIHIRFSWQATFVLRCRHPHSLCVAGVALAALGWVWWRVWAPIGRRLGANAAALWVAGMALGDIHLRFAWQAWHLVTSTFVLVFGCISYFVTWFVTWLSIYGLVTLAQCRKRPCAHLIDTLWKRSWPVSARLLLINT